MLENFIYAEDKRTFENALKNGEVCDEAIAFIEDTKEIWNHGTYFDCSGSSEVDVTAIYNTIQKNTDGINTEISRAKEVEQDINDKLYNEINRSVVADQDLSRSIDEETRRATEAEVNIVEDTNKKITTEVEKIKYGNTIVGQTREIHSRNGKTVTDSFLARTTAGSGTIGDGVASLKSVGGNIVKNLVNPNVYSKGNSVTATGTDIVHVIAAGSNLAKEYSTVSWNMPNKCIIGHKYYARIEIWSNEVSHSVFLGGKSGTCAINMNGTNKKGWFVISNVLAVTVIYTKTFMVYPFNYQNNTTGLEEAYLRNPLVIDLTEMYGAGNEPTKGECDRIFGTMDVLPQGLTVANPTEFKSIGFNQFNPDNVLEGKAIVDNIIVSGDKKIAVIPCLPCKVGTGENNGYCIHGEFGEDIKVYLTPLNPMEVEGELYMHELTKDATTDTYVPLIKGYMLVEVPNATDLCVHFLWSEDCDREAYEPYYESVVELPTIPEMSEYGLAGIQSSGTLVCDEIDFVKGVYRKKIGAVDMGGLNWTRYADITDAYVYYVRLQTININMSIINNAYTSVSFPSSIKELGNMLIVSHVDRSVVYLRDDSKSDVATLKSTLSGKTLYYELAEPIEYPLPKVDNNYTSSDYGVEQFDSSIPCNANNLYYMRSLAGETRNFLDRLMARLGISDATAVADKIADAIIPTTEGADVEPTEVIEE